jgi:hypothetical protein
LVEPEPVWLEGDGEEAPSDSPGGVGSEAADGVSLEGDSSAGVEAVGVGEAVDCAGGRTSFT